MSALTLFQYGEHEVRTVTIEGDPRFVLADIGEVLGTRGRDLARMVDDEDKGAHFVRTPSGEQEMATVTESGLYTLLVRSNNAAAKPFRRWVTSEVLPSIRKRGGYLTPEATEAALTDPDFIIRLATELKEERAARQALEPKAAYVDRFVDSGSDLRLLRAAANELEMREGDLRDLLLERGWIYEKPMGTRWDARYQKTRPLVEYWPSSEKSSYFRMVPQHKAPAYKSGAVRHTLMVTPPGMSALDRLTRRTVAA